MKKIFLAVFVAALVVSFVGGGTQAEAKNFPSKPITIICPWSAGGGTDRTVGSWQNNSLQNLVNR